MKVAKQKPKTKHHSAPAAPRRSHAAEGPARHGGQAPGSGTAAAGTAAAASAAAAAAAAAVSQVFQSAVVQSGHLPACSQAAPAPPHARQPAQAAGAAGREAGRGHLGSIRGGAGAGAGSGGPAASQPWPIEQSPQAVQPPPSQQQPLPPPPQQQQQQAGQGGDAEVPAAVSRPVLVHLPSALGDFERTHAGRAHHALGWLSLGGEAAAPVGSQGLSGRMCRTSL